jgi:RimJ/RimL family protein N-acetyltransferase
VPDFALPLEGTLTTPRLWLERLRPDHADEMEAVLDDQRLHAFVGGSPASLEGLRARYWRLAALRSDDGSTAVPSWIVRRRDDRAAIGAVHATVDAHEAEVGWVIGVASQGQGFATEAARAVMQFLEESGCTSIQAAIHTRHGASATVAARAGLLPTDEEVDGDRIWRKIAPRHCAG